MAKKLGDFFGNVDEVLNNAKISNFEEVFSRTKSFTEEVGKKSAERLEISRKKVECLDVKAKLAKTYEKFGRLQYDVYIGSQTDTESLQNAASEIAELRERLDVLTTELNVAKANFEQGKPSTKSTDNQVESTGEEKPE